MALESGTFISDLNQLNPTITDQIAEGDDHIRLIKNTLKTTFPSITGAVTLTHTQINGLPTDITTAQTTLQTNINNLDTAKAPVASPTFTGTPAAPTATTGTSTTQIATTAFVGTALSSFTAGASNIGENSVALGTKTTGNYASAVSSRTDNSSGTGSITVTGAAGEGTDFGVELSYKLASEGSVSDPPIISDFASKKFLFLY